MIPFGPRLRAAVAARGPLCVGVDPHAGILEGWGLAVSAGGARELGLRVVDAAADRVAAVKPQVAFFERFGPAGLEALAEVMSAARGAGLIVIADAKRGDIGTTMDGYAEAWLAPGAPLEADAMTLSPYLGVGALRGCCEAALAHGKGAFVLAATSNPEAAALQGARDGERSVAALVAQEVAALDPGADGWASIGLVVGATADLAATGLDGLLGPDGAIGARTPILAPGFGAQGARPEDLSGVFGAAAGRVLASESRSILDAGPDALAARIRERVARYAQAHAIEDGGTG